MNSLTIHILQQVSIGNSNSGRNGDPKSSVLGGTPRARFSSQAQKYSQRTDDTIRTRIPHETVMREGNLNPALRPIVFDILKARYMKKKSAEEPSETGEAGSVEPTRDDILKVMVYMSRAEARQIATLISSIEEELLAAREATINEPKNRAHASRYKELTSGALAEFTPSTSIDHALFGRFLAEVPEEFVAAATSYAHAFSTHRDQTVSDTFIAMDNETMTSAHLGERNLTAPLMYRCATMNIDLLTQHIGAEATPEAIQTWVHGFIRAMPHGMKNSAFSHTLPEYVLIEYRPVGHPITYANAFTEPAHAGGGETLLEASVRKLTAQVKYNDAAFGGQLDASNAPRRQQISVRAFTDNFPLSNSVEAALKALDLE